MKFLVLFFLSFSVLANPSTLDLIQGDKSVVSRDNKKLVMFWGSWCGECKEKLKTTLPEINKNTNIDVITVNMDKNEKRAKHIIKKTDLELPVVKGNGTDFAKELKVFAVPHWAVYEVVDGKWVLKESKSAFDTDYIKSILGV